MRALIVAPAWVGDAVMAHALVRRLADRIPGCTLEVVAPPATAPIAERMPEILAVHVLDAVHGRFGLGVRRRLGRALASRGFDRAYVLPNSWKSALVPCLAGVPERIGFVGELRYGLLTEARRLDRDRWPRLVDRYASLGTPRDAATAPAPAPRLLADPANAQTLRATLGLGFEDDEEGPVLACCPGAEFGEAKRWPAEHFASLIADRVELGWRVWLLGSPKDAAVTAHILSAVPAGARARVHDLAGRTRLVDAIDLLSCVDAVVTNDSGLLHVASALGRPVLAIYGSTSPAFTPPLGDRSAIESLDLPCAPCFERTCPLGHHACLRDLAPRRVDAALERLMSAER